MKILKEKINNMYWTSTFISFDNISSEGIHKVRFEEYIIHHNMLNKCPFHKPNCYVFSTLLVNISFFIAAYICAQNEPQ